MCKFLAKFHKKHFLGTLICLFVCISCSRNENNATEELQATFMHTNSLISSAGILAVFDDTLFLGARQQDYLFDKYLIDGDSLRLIGSLVKRGNGPNELLMAGAQLVNKQSHRLLFYDTNTSKAVEVLPGDTVKYRGIDSFRQPGNAFIMRAEYRSDSSLIACLINTNELNEWFADLNIISGELTIIPEFSPNDGIDSSPLTKQWLYNSGARLKKHPKQDWYVYTCDEGLYLELFKIKNDSIIDRKVLLNQYPKYHTGDDGVTPTGFPGEQLMGLQIDTTEDFIYATFSDMTYNDFRKIASGQTVNKLSKPGMTDGFDNRLYIFDWSGTLIKSYELSHPIANIAASDTKREIYGVTEDEDGEYQVVKYSVL